MILRQLFSYTCLVVLTSVFQGCFPATVPRYLFPIGENSLGQANTLEHVVAERTGGRIPSIALISSCLGDTKETNPTVSEVVGYQFILGLIPFTRIYIDGGINCYAEDLAIGELVKLGYDVYLARSESNANQLIDLGLKPPFKLNLQNFGISAYDLIFRRRVSISGDLQLVKYGPDSLPSLVKSIRLDYGEFRVQAQISDLNQILKRELGSSIANLISQGELAVGNTLIATVRDQQDSNSSLFTVIDLPTAENSLSNEVLDFISPKSKSKDVQLERHGAALRLVQKGLASGLDSSYALARISGFVPRRISVSQPIYRVFTEIKTLRLLDEANFRDSLFSQFSFKLIEQGLLGGTNIKSSGCEVQIPISGLEVVDALELASELAVKKFLGSEISPASAAFASRIRCDS